MRLADYRSILEQRINKQSNTNTFRNDLSDEISLAVQSHANNAYPWGELKQQDSFSTVASQREYIIPTGNDIDKINNLWHEVNDSFEPIPIASHNDYYRSNLSSTETSTYPNFAVIEQKIGMLAQPESAGPLTVVSSSSADVSIATTVFGLVSGYPDSETITTNATNGTTGSVGSKSFSKVYGFIKSATTTGRITLTSPPNTIAVIPAGKQTQEARYYSILLHPIPDSVQTIKYFYKRKQAALTNDNDFSILSDDHDNAILLLAEYFVLREPKTMALYEAFLKELIAKEQSVMNEPCFLEKRFASQNDGARIRLGSGFAYPYG